MLLSCLDFSLLCYNLNTVQRVSNLVLDAYLYDLMHEPENHSSDAPKCMIYIYI